MTTRSSGLLPQIILPDVIYEKFKGPCGHDSPAFSQIIIRRMSCLRNLKAPASMTTRRSGLFPKSFLPDVIFEKIKGPCRHDNPSFGAFLEEVFWKNLGRDGRSGSILTTPRSGILMRICLDRSKASKQPYNCLLYTSPSPRDATLSRMPSSA